MRILLASSAIALIAGLGAAPALAQDQENQDKQLKLAACDTTWNAVDRDQNATVSSEEARQAAELRFQRLDADNDGFIDVDEFANCRQADMAALAGDGSGTGDAADLTRTQPTIQSGEASQDQGEDVADLTPNQTHIQGQQGQQGQQAADTSQPQGRQAEAAGAQGNQSDLADLTETQPSVQQGQGSQDDAEDVAATQPRVEGQQQATGAEPMPSQAEAGANVPGADPDLARPDIAQADSDADQTVTREEFLAGVRQHYQQNRESFGGLSQEQHARFATFWFDRFDRDQSGDIDREELAAAEQLTQDGLSQADRDGDRMLSEEEWSTLEESRGAGGPNASGAATPAAAGQSDKEGFAALDADNDGKLSASEWLIHDERRRAEAAFFQIDANNDGTLSQEEWQAHTEARFQEAQTASAQAGAGAGPTLYRYYLFVY